MHMCGSDESAPPEVNSIRRVVIAAFVHGSLSAALSLILVAGGTMPWSFPGFILSCVASGILLCGGPKKGDANAGKKLAVSGWIYVIATGVLLIAGTIIVVPLAVGTAVGNSQKADRDCTSPPPPAPPAGPPPSPPPAPPPPRPCVEGHWGPDPSLPGYNKYFPGDCDPPGGDPGGGGSLPPVQPVPKPDDDCIKDANESRHAANVGIAIFGSIAIIMDLVGAALNLFAALKCFKAKKAISDGGLKGVEESASPNLAIQHKPEVVVALPVDTGVAAPAAAPAKSAATTADEIRKLSELMKDGVITADEFTDAKKKLLLPQI